MKSKRTANVLPVVLLVAVLGAVAAQDSTTLLDFTLDGGDITLDDVSTEIPDIQTIFNGKEFAVNVALSWSQLDEAVASSNVLKWQTFVDDVLTAEGQEALDESRGLPAEISAGTGSVNGSGSHVISVRLMLDDTETEVNRSYQSFNSGASFWPLVVVLVLAITTHMVELSLGTGVFVGACMVSGNIIDGYKTTLDTYILKAFSDHWHGFVYLFALFMSGLVGMMERSGGLQGLTVALRTFVKSTRSAQAAAFAAGLIIFFDDYANTLVVGNSMRPIMDGFMVSREKLAFIVDATAAPIASIVPVSSWVGFEVGLIQDEINRLVVLYGDDIKIGTSGFGVFLETIKFRYYPIFMLFLMMLLIASQRDMGPMLVAERKVKVYGKKDGGEGRANILGGDGVKSANKPEEDTPCRWWNMMVPVLFLIFFIFYLLVQTGKDPSKDQTFLDIMQLSASYSALLWGTMAAALVTYGFYMLQFKQDGRIVLPNMKALCAMIPRKCCQCKKRDTDDDEDEKYAPKPLMTVRETLQSFLAGMEHIFGALVVLTLAWASGSIMTAVGLDRLFSDLIVDSNLDYRMLPTISFLVSLFVAFATGTSWGTMTIMFPLLLVPTYQASDGDPVIFYSTTAGILSGAVAGDHCSPISDTTVLSSLASDCDLLEHVHTQYPYVLVAAIWSVLVGTIPIGRGAYPSGVGILLGFVFMLMHAVLLSASVINKTGRFDPFMELYLLLTKDPGLSALKHDTMRSFEQGGPVDPTTPDRTSVVSAGRIFDDEMGRPMDDKPGDDNSGKIPPESEENFQPEEEKALSRAEGEVESEPMESSSD